MATVLCCGPELGLRASASASAATILWRPRGVSLNSTPSPRKASFTALKMAAGGGMAPPSPTPLMPNSVFGDGALYVVDGNAGVCVAPGSMYSASVDA